MKVILMAVLFVVFWPIMLIMEAEETGEQED